MFSLLWSSDVPYHYFFFCLLFISAFEKGKLMLPIMIVHLPIFPFNSVSLLYKFQSYVIGCIHIYDCMVVISLHWNDALIMKFPFFSNTSFFKVHFVFLV